MSKKDLKNLKHQWYKALKDNGFLDIEDSKERLKTEERRSVSFQNREIILEFFLKLGEYLMYTPMTTDERRVLELYVEGKLSKKDIARRLTFSYTKTRNIIRKHKGIVLGLY